jgi:hypothetical protein
MNKYMGINLEYLNEFCEENRIFSTKYINNQNKHKIEYYFGVPKERLVEISNINQLEEKINEFGESPSQADKDFDEEINKIYREII